MKPAHSHQPFRYTMNAKSVLITGANRGIGLEFVSQILRLPNAPKWLFAACRNPDQATELQKLAASSPSVKVLKLELTSPESIQIAVNSVDKLVGENGLNLLINNAAFSNAVSLDDLTEDNMIEHFRVNSVAPLMICKAFLPLLKRAASRSNSKGMSVDKAAVVNISSLLGSIDKNNYDVYPWGFNGGLYSYRSSKAALNQITRGLSMDLKPDGILAAVLHPGWVQTDMGGPRASLTAAESVTAMLRVLGNLNDQSTGTFLSYDGTTIPW